MAVLKVTQFTQNTLSLDRIDGLAHRSMQRPLDLIECLLTQIHEGRR